MGRRGKRLSCPAVCLPTSLSFWFWSSVLSLPRPIPCCRTDSSEAPEWRAAAQPHSHLPRQNFVSPNVLITSILVCICVCSRLCRQSPWLFVFMLISRGSVMEGRTRRANFFSFPFPRLLLMFKLEIWMSGTWWGKDARVLVGTTAVPVESGFSVY